MCKGIQDKWIKSKSDFIPMVSHFAEIITVCEMKILQFIYLVVYLFIIYVGL